MGFCRFLVADRLRQLSLVKWRKWKVLFVIWVVEAYVGSRASVRNGWSGQMLSSDYYFNGELQVQRIAVISFSSDSVRKAIVSFRGFFKLLRCFFWKKTNTLPRMSTKTLEIIVFPLRRLQCIRHFLAWTNKNLAANELQIDLIGSASKYQLAWYRRKMFAVKKNLLCSHSR